MYNGLKKKSQFFKRLRMNDAELNYYYNNSLKNFTSAIYKSIDLSRAISGRFTIRRLGDASILFTRMCVTGVSILAVAPKNKSSKEHWDFSAIAALARSLLECYLTFWYLTVEQLDEDEMLARLNLMHLHDCISRIEMFENLGTSDADPHMQGFANQAQELRERLMSRQYFINTFTEKQKHKLLKGKTAHFLSQDDILRRMGIDIKDFRFHWHFFSLHVHSFPASFYRVTESKRGRGIENEVEKGYIAQTLEYLEKFIQRAIKDMLTLFPDMAPSTK